MTLKEALLSGKNFRRKGWVDQTWYDPNVNTTIMFSLESVLADDYEIQPDPVVPLVIFTNEYGIGSMKVQIGFETEELADKDARSSYICVRPKRRKFIEVLE